jgi:hypothetical protein
VILRQSELITIEKVPPILQGKKTVTPVISSRGGRSKKKITETN